MKKIKIGKIEGHLCESTADIWDIRWSYFKIYMYRALEFAEQPLFAGTFQEVMSHLNQGRYAQAAIVLADYEKMVTLEKAEYDSLSYCFALIFLNEEELKDQSNMDENKLQEKLDLLRKNGLTRGFVEEAVMGFTEKSLSISNMWKVRLQTLLELKELYTSED